MLNINQLMSSSESNIIRETSRSSFYESVSLVSFEKSLNLDYNEYQLKNFINSRTSGEGFKEAVKGGLQKIWKFIKGIIDMIVKGFNNFWQTIKKIFSRKKKKDNKKDDKEYDKEENEKMKDELNTANKEANEYKKKYNELKEELEKTLDDKEDLQDKIKALHKENASSKEKLKTELEENKKLQRSLEYKIEDMERKISNLEEDLEANEKNNKITINRLKRDAGNLNDNIIYAERRYTKLENEHAEKYGELKAERMLKDFNYIMKHIRELCIIVDDRFFDVLAIKERFNDKDYMENKAIKDLKSKMDYDISKRGDTIDTRDTIRNNITVDEIIESLNTRIERLNIAEIRDALSKGYDVNNQDMQKKIFAGSSSFYLVKNIREMIGENRGIKRIQKKVDNILRKLSNDTTTDKDLLHSQTEYVKLFLDYINGIYKITKKTQHKLLNFLLVVEPYVPENIKINLSDIRH